MVALFAVHKFLNSATRYKSYKLHYLFRRLIRVEDNVVTWIYDETGSAAAILDEFCLRNLDGVPQAWVFGVSVFSMKGEHIGWFEHGVLFDLHNDKLGFIEGALGLSNGPALQAAPPMPPFGKRPTVPALRARRVRPARSGWSGERVAEYLDNCDSLSLSAAGAARAVAHARSAVLDVSH